MFEIGDVVLLNVDIPKYQLKAGMLGTIVHIYDPMGYEIELMDDPKDELLLTYTVYKFQIKLAWSVKTEQWLIQRPDAGSLRSTNLLSH
jgi:hypothetical protein